MPYESEVVALIVEADANWLAMVARLARLLEMEAPRTAEEACALICAVQRLAGVEPLFVGRLPGGWAGWLPPALAQVALAEHLARDEATHQSAPAGLAEAG